MDSQLLLSIALVAALIVAVSDMIMLGRPTTGRAFLTEPFKAIGAVSARRVLLGNILGVLALPGMLVGLLPLYRILEAAGPFWAAAQVILLGWSLAIGTASHASWPFMGLLTEDDAGPHSGIARRHFMGITLASGLLFTAGGVCLAFVIAIFETGLYRGWALNNPVLFYFAGTAMARWLPGPAGGYLAPAVFNLGWAIFYGTLLFAA